MKEQHWLEVLSLHRMGLACGSALYIPLHPSSCIVQYVCWSCSMAVKYGLAPRLNCFWKEYIEKSFVQYKDYPSDALPRLSPPWLEISLSKIWLYKECWDLWFPLSVFLKNLWLTRFWRSELKLTTSGGLLRYTKTFILSSISLTWLNFSLVTHVKKHLVFRAHLHFTEACEQSHVSSCDLKPLRPALH